MIRFFRLVALAAGPLWFLYAVADHGTLPKDREWLIVFCAVLGVSGCAYAMVRGMEFIFKHRTAKLHNDEGLARFAVLSMVTGLVYFLWAVTGVFDAWSDRDGLVLTALLIGYVISVCSWLAMNLIGWALAGVGKDANSN